VFRDALALAQQFTFPVILSQKTVAGKCSSSIGAFVVVNADGWIVTAGHILEQFAAAQESVKLCRTRDAQRIAIRDDQSIDEKERRNRLKKLGHEKPEDIDRFSALWGTWQTQATEYHIVNGVDLGLVKLAPFDPAWVTAYPTFKDPTHGVEPGVSLCKLGYPFHAFEPTYDKAADMFNLPPGALPAPLFPLEGMFTRTAQLVDPADPNPEIPLFWLETSTPGLRGQSGGPTFDSKGTVWAIQCRTAHFDLGFNTFKSPQYLNVGHGVHPLTLFKVFEKLAVKYTASTY
jgi:hypothetical protein